MANKVGRPRQFDSPDAMLQKALEFQAICTEEERPFLFISFASWMGIHADTITRYATDFPEFSGTIKKIKQLAEIGLIEGGMMGRYNPAMTIFLAKNNHGYTDKQEIDMKAEQTIKNIDVNFVNED